MNPSVKAKSFGTKRPHPWRSQSIGCLFCLLSLSFGISTTPSWANEDQQPKALQLTLPSVCYAVVGVPMSIYYDNLVLTDNSLLEKGTGSERTDASTAEKSGDDVSVPLLQQAAKPEPYRFQVQSDLGTAEARRWTVTPAPADAGNHELLISVSDLEGKPLEQGKLVVRVAPADAGVGRSIRLLLVGDSLTHDPRYPNEFARLLSEPGNPTWTMLGTHRPSGVAERVMHEGYGGWTWEQFVKHWAKQNPTKPAEQGNGSPLVVAVDAGGPTVDLDQYFSSSCGGHRPDYVILLLGINDCFHVDPDNPAAIDARISAVFTHADRLVAAFRKSAPKAELGIGLTTPPNSRESGFEANYHGQYHRWGWKRIQHRLVQRELEHFDGRQAEQIFIIPTELNLDPVDGFPVDNGVHPNNVGYQQIAATVFAWLKSRLEAPEHD